jgi:hypothetical protein
MFGWLVLLRPVLSIINSFLCRVCGEDGKKQTEQERESEKEGRRDSQINDSSKLNN